MAKTVLIIGGGHNGLVCACYLAKAGLDVTVLEKRHIVGGAAVTEEFFPGFRNSVASYTVSLLHEKIMKDLCLAEHGLKIIDRRINNYLPLPDGNSFLGIADPERQRAEVARFSEKDADKLVPFHAELGELVEVIREWLLLSPPRMHKTNLAEFPALFRLGKRFSGMSLTQKNLFVRLFGISAGEMLDDQFESDPIKALTGFDSIVGHYASPYHPGSAYVLLHHLIGGVNGKAGTWGHAMGGMGSITQAMAAQAEHLGVRLETGVDVREVIVSRKGAVGVELDSGEKIFRDIIVANVNPKLLHLKLLPREHVKPETVAHFMRYKCQSGTFRMNVALSELPKFTARMPEDCLTAGIIMAPSLQYMDNAYHDARRYGYSRQPIVEMLIPSVVDDSLAPSGMHVASLFCQQFNPDLGEAWLDKKAEAAAHIIDTVSTWAPNFKASVIGQQVLSPFDLETKFGLTGGDIFHGRLSVEQLFSARPMLGIGQYKTEIGNLYMCGSGTHPGGGVSGMPGHNAADAILRDL